MTKSFDEWFGEASQNKLFWESPSKASKMGFEAGQQSKQAEVDELQKRIDEALKTSKEFYDFGVGESAMAFCGEIMNILKGDSHES